MILTFPSSCRAMTSRQRAMALLDCAVSQLEMEDAEAVDASFLERLDDFDTRISLLRARLKLKRSTVHLCSQFGRAT